MPVAAVPALDLAPDPQIGASPLRTVPAGLTIKPAAAALPYTPGGSFGASPGGGGKMGQITSPNRIPTAPIEPPASLPAAAIPRSPALPAVELPPIIPAGIAAPLGAALKLAAPISAGLALPGAVQNLVQVLEKDRNIIQRLIDPPIQLAPSFSQAADRVRPITPTPYQANDAVMYQVTVAITFGGTTFQGDSANSGGSIDTFELIGPILGTGTETSYSPQGDIIAKGLYVLHGDPPVRRGIGGGANLLGGGIVRIVRIPDSMQVWSSPNTSSPNVIPVRSFPAAPQMRQPPPSPAPTVNPSVPAGSVPAPASPTRSPSAPNPIAPAFPAQPPNFPALPNIGGVPIIPLGMPQRLAAPNAAPGASPSASGGASGGAPNANPYYEPKWADPGATPSPGESGTPATPTPTDPTGFLCRFQFDQQLRSGVTEANTGIGQANTKISAVEATELSLQSYVTAEVTTIQAKLGDAIPGGISAQLLLQWGRVVKIWNFLQVDRLLNVLTWVGVLHNAYQLSSGLTQTLFSAIGNVLDVIGIQKVDAQGNESPYEIGSLVSQWTDGFFKRIFGVETVNGIKTQWKKYNRIYQAATNIINSTQSMVYSMLSALETVGGYVSAIGNAAKTFGVFAENAYNWMSPNFNFTTGKWFKVLNNVQETVEVIDNVASEVQSIQQTASDLQGQKAELDTAVAQGVEAKGSAETVKKQQSQGATITPESQIKPNT